MAFFITLIISPMYHHQEEKEITIDLAQTKKVALILRAINHKLRKQIIDLLNQHKRLSVKEIYIKTRIEKSILSQHLSILRNAGFVIAKREGQQIFYSVNHQRLLYVQQIIDDVLKNTTSN